ncbi:MAG: hypothetical protein OXD44_09715 [Gammaproteobacteria bacterium]|nr:hypothetical protein [Gammaproteobacteria bacterium]
MKNQAASDLASISGVTATAPSRAWFNRTHGHAMDPYDWPYYCTAISVPGIAAAIAMLPRIAGFGQLAMSALHHSGDAFMHSHEALMRSSMACSVAALAIGFSDPH